MKSLNESKPYFLSTITTGFRLVKEFLDGPALLICLDPITGLWLYVAIDANAIRSQLNEASKLIGDKTAIIESWWHDE